MKLASTGPESAENRASPQGLRGVHSVLARQLRSLGVDASAPPDAAQWRNLLVRLDQTYLRADQLHATVSSMGDGLCVLDPQGVVEMANPAAERLLAAAPGDLVGQQLGDVVAGFWPFDQERRAPLLALRQAIRDGGSCRVDDARFMTFERRWLPVSFALTPIDDHAVRGSVLIFSDIRERKQVADALRESESRFRAIFESAAVGIVRLDVHGQISDHNRAFGDMIGVAREALTGKSLFDTVQPDQADAARARFEALRAGRKAERQVERSYLHRSGSTVWGMETISFVRNSAGDPVFAIGIVENLTARKHLEVSLLHAQKLEAVGQLAAGIAHEINTPIQFVGDSVHFVRDAMTEVFVIIDGYRSLREAAAAFVPEAAARMRAEEERADLAYLIEQVPRAFDRAIDGLGRVATIVRGMKEFAHPSGAEQAPADLNHALETTLTIAKNEYKYVADVESAYGELPPVMCHVGELNQVFLNIVVNAAHAIGDVVQGTDRRGRIGVKTWCEGGNAFVAISDTGGGIPVAVRDKVFEPFFTTKAVGRGTGQGLAIARAVVVDKHRGDLTFQSELGVGTTFVLRLPVDGAPAPPSDAR
jgi:PAS domain S-box-containing protein